MIFWLALSLAFPTGTGPVCDQMRRYLNWDADCVNHWTFSSCARSWSQTYFPALLLKQTPNCAAALKQPGSCFLQ